MTGTIRAKGKCKKCGGRFVLIPDVGLFCPVHESGPKRVYIDLPWKGQRIRIFCDKTGQPLDTYQRADRLLSHINWEIQNFQFDQTKYVRAEAENFWMVNLLKRFLETKLGNIAPSYKAHYQKMVQRAKDFFGNKDVREIRKLDIINYKENLEKGDSLSAKTIKNNLELLKTFLRWCQNDLEIITLVPPFPLMEVQPPKFRWVSQDDQIKLFECVKEEDRPIIAFLMLHGCRPSEARGLKCGDVDLTARVITISGTFSGNVYREKRKGRGARPVTIPIHPECLGYIDERVRGSLPGAFLFINPRTEGYYSAHTLLRIWKTVRIKAKITPDLRLYDATRHSFASQLVNSGTSIFKVSKLLGHSSVKMTEKYAHHSIEGLRTDVQKLSLQKVATVTKVSPEAKSA